MNIFKKLQIKRFNKKFIKVFGKEIFDLLGTTVVGKAKRNNRSFDLFVKLNNGILLIVDRGKIVELNEDIRYCDEFYITFIITEKGLMKVININDKQIYTSFNDVAFAVENIVEI